MGVGALCGAIGAGTGIGLTNVIKPVPAINKALVGALAGGGSAGMSSGVANVIVQNFDKHID